jgi:hypothetical protein
MVRVTSNRLSSGLTAAGSVAGQVECCGEDGNTAALGSFTVAALKLALGDAKPFIDGPVSAEFVKGTLTLAPIDLDLGAPQPAVLSAYVDNKGLTMHLTGPLLRSRLMALANALPQFGDGLKQALPEIASEEEAAATVEAPIRVDLVSTRTWAGGQVWGPASPKPRAPRKTTHRH